MKNKSMTIMVLALSLSMTAGAYCLADRTQREQDLDAKGDCSIEVSFSVSCEKKVKSIQLTLWKKSTEDEKDKVLKEFPDYTYWKNDESNEIWLPQRHLQTYVKTTYLEELTAGEYRITVVNASKNNEGDPTPFGVSEAVKIDSDNSTGQLLVHLEGNANVTLQFIEEETNESIANVRHFLIREDGSPVGKGSGNFKLMTGTDGKSVFNYLRPETYSLKAVRYAYKYGMDEYRTVEDKISVTATEEKDVNLIIPMYKAELTNEEIEERWPWHISGTVVNEQGEPIEGAKVCVSRGIGSLIPSGTVLTNDKGKYDLRFNRGFVLNTPQDNPKLLQAAIIHVEKEGFHKCSLHRSMPISLPLKDDAYSIESDTVLLPNKEYAFDFTMTAIED